MVTLMIPTMNRSDFLIRLLQYYADTDYPYSICIGDSSDQTHLERTKEFIKTLNGKLKVKHLEYPNLSISMCLKSIVDELDTPYAAITPDDDFIVTKTLEKCIHFLEQHPDYSAAHGSALMFSLKDTDVYSEFSDIGRYPQRAVEESIASERLISHLKNYNVTVFSVQRSQAWKKMYKNVKQLSERAFMEELLPCCLSVIHGKIKHYDDLYLVRQRHQRHPFLSDIYDWMTNPDWNEAYRIFHDSLVAALIQQDSISKEEAQAVFKKAFWGYLNGRLSAKFKQRYGILSLKERAKKISNYIPGAYKILKKTKQLFFSRRLTLNSLLNRKSVYYTDFLPVYRAVTNIPTNYQKA